MWEFFLQVALCWITLGSCQPNATASDRTGLMDFTLPKTNSSPLRIDRPSEKESSFHPPPFFRGELAVSFRVRVVFCVCLQKRFVGFLEVFYI